MSPLPRCTCGGAICGYGKALGRRYRCKGCKRLVPWCFGAADDMPLHCDDCWYASQPVEDGARVVSDPLGPSNDDSEAVRVEILAAQQIADMAADGAGESHMWRNDDTGTLTNIADGPMFDGFNDTLWAWDTSRPIAEQFPESRSRS